jgi:UDP-N-acetyl-2-amino-2-deoxyglucuronate dehydrogenase
MDKLKTAVIGYGKVAHTHAEALSSIPESEFVAVCGRDAVKAQAFAEQYGVKPFTSVEEMVGAGVQAVVVATPHPAHASVTTAALRAGAHAIVEKPLASSLEDCDAMIAAAREDGRTLAMISQRRLYAPVQRVRQAIDAGKISRPVLGTVAMLGWRSEEYYRSDPWRGSWDGEGGGVLVNQAPHQIDILQWFMGDVDELYGAWANLNHPYIEVEDSSVAVIRFKSGALGNIVASNSQNPGIFGKVWVHGSNGATVGVQTDGGSMFIAGMTTVTEPPVNDVWTVPGEQENLARWQKEDADFFRGIDATKHYHRLQIQDFLQSILEGREPLVPGEEGRKTVEIFTAIYRSQRDGRPVKFPLLPEKGRSDHDGRKAHRDER